MTPETLSSLGNRWALRLPIARNRSGVETHLDWETAERAAEAPYLENIAGCFVALGASTGVGPVGFFQRLSERRNLVG